MRDLLKKLGSLGAAPDFENRLPKGILDRDRARVLRRQQTDAEQKLWMKLRNRRILGVKFRRQYPVGSYIADFCALDRGLIVELDGSQHAEMQESDQIRTHFLESLGYRVVRFWNSEVLGDMDSVLERIGNYL